ncbi:MAG TPA: hypothetical protein VJ505_09815 [Holophagaceae bacterium]|nr:hypothetical protein [Holophagaceae bacterium]
MHPLQNPHGNLFAVAELRAVIDARLGAIKGEVERLEANRLLNTTPEDLVPYFLEKYGFQPLRLEVDQATIEHQEAKLDVSRDPSRRFFFDHHDGPLLVDATRFNLHVPFTGDEELFTYKPERHLMKVFPGRIEGNCLILSHTFELTDSALVERHFDQILQEINQMVGYGMSQVASFNNRLPAKVLELVNSRRARLLETASVASSLKYPLRLRPGAPETYVVPSVRKRIAPVLPPAPSGRFQPEPTLDLGAYEDVLRSLRSMSLVMERNPSTFCTQKEEEIRTLFLVALNAAFEGEASGETFNGSGKTDILIRHMDQNLFIGECKFWKGPKGFREAIDQLMGYVTWRDTKTALLIFNRDRETSKVLESSKESLVGHPRFKRMESPSTHGNFRAILGQERDPGREVILEVLIFDVPGTA